FIRPEMSRRGFTDQNEARVRLRFLLRKAAPARDAQSERLKVIGGNKIESCLQGASVRLCFTGQHDRCRPYRAGQRLLLRQTDAFYARQRAQSRGKATTEISHLPRPLRGALRAGAECENIFGNKSRINRLQLLQIARQQPCGDQQGETGGDLRYDEYIAQA